MRSLGLSGCPACLINTSAQSASKLSQSSVPASVVVVCSLLSSIARAAACVKLKLKLKLSAVCPSVSSSRASASSAAANLPCFPDLPCSSALSVCYCCCASPAHAFAPTPRSRDTPIPVPHTAPPPIVHLLAGCSLSFRFVSPSPLPPPPSRSLCNPLPDQALLLFPFYPSSLHLIHPPVSVRPHPVSPALNPASAPLDDRVR